MRHHLPTILIAEEHLAVQKDLLNRFFNRGVNTVLASDGLELFHLMDSYANHLDLIIISSNLHGFRLTGITERLIKRNRRHLPILVLGCHGEPTGKIEKIKKGQLIQFTQDELTTSHLVDLVADYLKVK